MTFNQFQEQVKIFNKDTSSLNNIFLQYVSNNGVLAQILEIMTIKSQESEITEDLVVAYVGRLSIAISNIVSMCSLLNVDFEEIAKAAVLSLMQEDENKEEDTGEDNKE